MSNLGQFRGGGQAGLPTPPRGVSIAKYTTYVEAQRAVDHLSDSQFPVQAVTIVGSGLRMVERVTGRLTYGRVAVAGALSGAWFGIFVGLLLSLLSDAAIAGVIGAMLLGAGFGMLFGIISYAATRGRRDFTSTSQIVASEYEVLCIEEHAGRAMQLLRSLDQGVGRSGPGGGGTAPATVAPAPPTAVGGAAPPVEPPITAPETAASAAPVEAAGPPPAPSGPTYGEMIDRQRAERRAQVEREEREAREQADRERADRERAAAVEAAAKAEASAEATAEATAEAEAGRTKAAETEAFERPPRTEAFETPSTTPTTRIKPPENPPA